MDIQKRIREIQKRVADATVRSGRKPQDVTVLAVTKTVSPDMIKGAYGAGLRDFGENRVQEALGKMEAISSDARWHLIGRLQTNKINKALGKFVLIHSIDSLPLAKDLSIRARDEPQDFLLEVNTSGEESKAGVIPSEAMTVARSMAQLKGLRLRGLMTVGPLTEDRQIQRDSFKRLKELFDDVRKNNWAGDSFSILSMGMSGDFELAIEEGSTLVRVGTAIFGPRS